MNGRALLRHNLRLCIVVIVRDHIPFKSNRIQLTYTMGDDAHGLFDSKAVHFVLTTLGVHPLGHAGRDPAVAEVVKVFELLEHGLPRDASSDADADCW